MRNLLKSVSRSFYISLNILPSDIRPAIGMGYLICRLADTIADTDVVPAVDRDRLLASLLKSLQEKPQRTFFLPEVTRAVTGGSPAERNLLSRTPELLKAFDTLNQEDRHLIIDLVGQITAGMKIDLAAFPPKAGPAPTPLHTPEMLESYIALIGGEPGRFWSKVCLVHRPSLPIVQRAVWIYNGIQFGKGLQMINILKDMMADATRGRCYVPAPWLAEFGITPSEWPEALSTPSGKELTARLAHRTAELLEFGLDYLEEIPRNEWRMRMAVWMPMVLAWQTLKLWAAPTGRGKPVKVGRGRVYLLMWNGARNVWINGALRRRVERCKSEVLSLLEA